MDVDVFRTVKTVVVHYPCADGMASALVLKEALPAADFKFVQYGTLEYLSLMPEPGVLFCDIVPPVECLGGAVTPHGLVQAQEWAAAGAVVLDHHAGVAGLVAVFGDRGVYADAPGVSGALLAYREVWLPLWAAARVHSRSILAQVEDFAKFAGVRDTWQTEDPRWHNACAQAAALMFWPKETLLREALHEVVRDRLAVGEVLLERQASADTKTIAEAHRFSIPRPAHGREGSGWSRFDGPVFRGVCFEGDSRSTSDVAERLGPEVDFVVGWHYFVRDGEECVKLSCRSRGRFEVLPFAQWLGGGGHTRAASAVMSLTRDPGLTQDPFSMVDSLVREYLGRLA